MKKGLIILIAIIALISVGVIASDLVIDSDTQSYDDKEQKLKFDGNVEVTLDKMKVLGNKADVEVKNGKQLDTVTFYDKPYAFELQENKKREVKANILKLSLISKVVKAIGDAQSTVYDGEDPVAVIMADVQEYDTKTNVMSASGNVTIKYDNLNTFSNRAVIRTNKSGDLKRIDLYGNAKLKQEKHTAEADHFIYDAEKEQLIAEGHTMSNMVNDDGTTLKIKGNYQQFDKKVNTFAGSGNVQVWYQDYYAKGPKMTVYPDKKTNKFNEVYFTGRSLINQDTKTVYADKIKLVMNPKTFYAEGNTRTVIGNIESNKDLDKNGKNK